jgi:hypothetical protein
VKPIRSNKWETPDESLGKEKSYVRNAYLGDSSTVLLYLSKMGMESARDGSETDTGSVADSLPAKPKRSSKHPTLSLTYSFAPFYL